MVLWIIEPISSFWMPPSWASSEKGAVAQLGHCYARRNELRRILGDESGPNVQRPARSEGWCYMRTVLRSRSALFVGFAFAVMADPVSSVAYAIEATLRALGGNLSLLLPTMALVIAIIAIIVVNYQQIVARFPHGGGAASAVASSFGLGWAFMPLGALLVDFVLTIAISVAAAASALIAFLPALGGDRVLVALVFLGGVATLTLLGQAGRLVFASMTIAFLVVVSVLLAGASSAAAAPPVNINPGSSNDLLSVVFAFPVGMALATGVEAPSSAIAQLGQLGDQGRRTFGRWTLWATLGFVSAITLGLTLAIVRLGIGIPAADSTLLADLARAATPPILFGLFQITSGVLLLAAASSSFQAGPGLLKSLARGADRPGVLPAAFGRTNRHHTPRLGVLVSLLLAAAMVIASGGHEQQLVLFYAVAVFASFLFGLAAMARHHRTDRSRWRLLIDLVALVLVGFTLAVNLTRGFPIISLATSIAVGLVLRQLWIRAGRPTGVQVSPDGEGVSEAPVDAQTT